MSVFSALIQRPEPRNMIRTMFLGKQAWDKAERRGEIPAAVNNSLQVLASQVADAVNACPGLRKAGFGAGTATITPVQNRVGADFWFRSDPAIATAISQLGDAVAETIASLSPEETLQLDHASARAEVVPAYLGGASGLASLR
jgi:3-hydroxyacyl-CoA dehydrogenase/enoyl-CoA hydratase/3-hydroxybutyryl-CoA epimerase